jgi:hypothetical protein
MDNVAEVEPAGIDTVEGTLTAVVFELESDITAPLLAGPESVTVAVLDCPLEIELGLRDRLESLGADWVDGVMVTPKPSLTPPYDAVNSIGVEVVTLPAVALKVAEFPPCGIVIDNGRVTSPGDALRAIVAPPLGAACVRDTVQENPASDRTDVELQEKPFKPADCPIVTIPGVVDTGSDHPALSAANGFAS